MSKYEEAKSIAIKGLEKALISHENANWLELENNLDLYENAIPREEVSPNSLLYLTLEFWSAWADSANHDHWDFYPPMGKNDYPRLAKILLNNLQSNAEVTNEEIVKNFSVYPTMSIFSKLKGMFKRT
jgi:hypothetical protein